jgi:heterodisulfide reductase subunit A-like polyferredoxin
MTGAGQNGDAKGLGAVLVLGGGIAGMQASLDLANGGFKVYLVERKSAIGGHMAKLDKTFPTNDCAMCTISPRLVEVGRHPNIELLTDSELLALEGRAGDFTATLRTRPRYIDLARCNGCGKCAEVCPERLSNPFDEGLGERRAAYKLYPQATPDAFAIEKRGVAPCRDACPAGQRAQGYISLLRAGRIDEAYRAIKEDNPFPGICGRICDHRCESACSRGKVEEPVNIHGLKRFIADAVYAKPRVKPAPAARRFDERVAIVGAGPCGLTVAQDLCLEGYPVTVFEALPVAGGMLRFGVPDFRLPAAIVDREVQDIVDLGVDLRLGTPVESLDDLLDQGYAAVLMAVGAHEGIRLPIPGGDLDGILINTRFLRDVRLAELGAEGARDPRPDIEGKRVLVVGGGDVAVDVARTAVRLGARDVRMAVRGSGGRMPAKDSEIARAREEGIRMHVGLNFLRVVDDGTGRAAGLECQTVERFETDENGRAAPRIVPGSEHVLDADVIIFSVGQRVGLAFVPDDAGVGVTPARTIAVDPDTCMTDRPGIFAAGDSISGTAFVIEAVAGGHRVAGAIHRYLRGEAMKTATPAGPPVAELSQQEIDARLLKGEIGYAPRRPMPEIAVADRAGNFTEIELGYSMQDAMAEAERCLSCGICSECLTCVAACGLEAIDHEMTESTRRIPVGAAILAPGFEPYRAELSEEFGLGRYPNVVTSLQFERLLSASGPTTGQVKRPSDGRTPKKIAFLQCVGSRDQSHDYCSAVCCMYGTKQAIMAIEHEPETEARVFMMDVRAFSKGYEAYYQRARDTYGIAYTRCRISALKEDPATGDLFVKYVDRGAAAAEPEVRDEAFDMVVLSVGMEVSEGVRALGRELGLELDAHGFCRTVQFDPVRTSRPGVYAVGPFREPKDIAESLIEASAAAASAEGMLVGGRGSQTRAPVHAAERDVAGQEPRTAVFVCHCGTNIGGVVDVPGVACYARSLPGVIHAEDSLYACSKDSIEHITKRVKELDANRVVIAACTPLTHEPLFQDSIRAAGLNPYLFEMANIRNQCSWVHGRDPAVTEKAKTLVRMSAARATELAPLATDKVPIRRAALVVGGGAAGMTAALELAAQNVPVHLVEKSDALGGNLRRLHFGIDDSGTTTSLPPDGEDRRLGPQDFLRRLLGEIAAHPLVTVHLGTEVAGTEGFVGNFTSTLRPSGPHGQPFEVRHGVSILATGGVEYRGDEYGYGTSPRIVTQQEFEARLAGQGGAAAEAPALPRSVVMIQCVGPAEKFCARVCCTSALKNALMLKRRDPEARVTILYRDIRVYGFKERLYTAARESGVLFVRYDETCRPRVRVAEDDGVEVAAWEEGLGRDIVLRPDLLVLSTPFVPSAATQELGRRLRLPVDADGFFLEAHVKLRPVDFLSDGVFMAGMAHYPKLLDEAIVHAKAAAARAAALLSQDAITTGGRIAAVDQARCVACLTCLRTCPYGAAHIAADLDGVAGIAGAATIESALCRGCGLCAAACPAGAIELKHYTGAQVMAKVGALLEATAREEVPA